MNTLESLTNKINNAKALDFGSIISDSIDFFKKIWLKGFLVVLILMACALVVNFIFGIVGLSPYAYNFEDGFSVEMLAELQATNILYSIPQNIILTTLSLVLMGGFYRICKQTYLNENVTDDYFYFFKKEHFSKLLMLGIIHTGIGTVAQLMLFIPFIYVFVPLSYFAIVYSNNPHLTEMEVVKASFRIGNKKWLITFGTIFVTGILAMLGILGCVIGLLFTMSIVYLPVFFIYKDVVGFDNVSEIDQIGVRDNLDY
ncbi:hypothetical protein [Aestuariivivens insulae]|uniref:hypothetical protein n=1 Tax=Aestuariivivens insulae TaxID=1621988 RepID=UPI001F5AA3C9|nr:hypothetical protein [Aestuariivivens insulae]